MAPAPAPEPNNSSGKASSPKNSKMHRRSRSGCFTCRLRRKKCSEEKPRCRACKNLGLECEYKRPSWWSNNETRRKQKDSIKNMIKRTKSNEKNAAQDGSSMPPSRRHSMPVPGLHGENMSRHRRSSSEESDDFEDGSLDPTFAQTPGFHDPHGPAYYGHHFPPPDPYGHGYTYEVDVRTEKQTFINDVPTRKCSSTLTYSACYPPVAHGVLPSYTGDDFLQQHPFDVAHEEWPGEEALDFNFFDFSHTSQGAGQASTAMIPVDDSDRPLLDHLFESVLPLVFPILEISQHGTVRAEVIIPSLESNKAYLHCCLSAAAIHKKSIGQASLSTDGDILRHKFAFVQEVVGSLGADTNHLQVLEATLGMISLQCITGHAEEAEKDIPWHQHFQAAIELVHKLELPALLDATPAHGGHPPFNMTLAAWIDILGSTMLGRAPVFADTYRNRHLAAGGTGLAELMGCQDNVMYLLSEVACLDALRLEHRLDDIGICSHVQNLGRQLDATENPNEMVMHPYSSRGTIQPKQLSRNITAIFRKALRIYLCTLVPGFDRYGQAAVNLVSQITDMLQYIPGGPDGFDRSLIWPLLIAGANSTPTSTFRKIFAERSAALGIEADLGNFGRLAKLLREVWRCNDETTVPAGGCEVTPITAGAISPLNSLNTSPLAPSGAVPSVVIANPTVPLARIQDVHWRDVMREQCWEFLLI